MSALMTVLESLFGTRTHVWRSTKVSIWLLLLPKTIVFDNGPGFTSKAMYFRAKKVGVKLHFIQPGKPTQNAFVESFNGKMRAYCLDLHWFASIDDARSTIDDWQQHYNHVRPHRSLGKKPPAVFAKEAA